MDIPQLFSDPSVVFIIANSLYAVSYMMTRLLWLRIIAIAAAVSTFPYFYLTPDPQWSTLYWQCGFAIINTFNLGFLLYTMRTPTFDLIEHVVYKTKFIDLEPHEVVPIFKLARRVVMQPGDVLFREGDRNETLFLIIAGKCSVMKNDMEVATLKSMEFVGELSFVSLDPVSTDVVVSEETELMCWDKSALEPLFAKQGLYKSYFFSMCSIDMAHKLRNMTTAASAGA